MDDSYWIYEYDSLGQVKSGKKYWSDGTPVAGQQFVYSHDDIGNRKHAAAGGDQWGANLRYEKYNVNSLNQYTSRTVPGAMDVMGTANSNSVVTVNNQATYRKGEYFRAELSLTNQSAPVYQGVTNLAVMNDSPDPDIVTNSTGHVLLAATPEAFLHDSDGNLVRDGLWTNVWNAENRLTRTESLSIVPEAARARVDWTYLPDGRWIERIVSTWVSGAYVAQSTNRFVWDGQVLLAILDQNNLPVTALMRGLDLSGSIQGAGGVGGLLAVTSHSGFGIHFVANDGNGNVTLLLRSVDGAESARYSYSPFGETLQATGDMARKNPVRFSTQFADDLIGGAKYLYREYMPRLARWLSRDPIAEDAFVLISLIRDRERYQLRDEALAPANLFLRNDPLNKHDFLGLVNNWERLWCSMNFCCCLAAQDSNTKIEQNMHLIHPEYPNENGKSGNAIKHCAWMCYVASLWACHMGQAYDLGVAHEMSDSGPDREMDLYNNNVGISLSENGQSLEACIDKCKEKADEKVLTWIR